MLWLFLGGIVSVNLLSRSGRISAVNYEGLFPQQVSSQPQVTDKRVMVLEEGLTVYQQNSLGGYFLDWELSAPLFNDLTKYDHVEIISSCFKEDPPDMILDSKNLMEAVIQRVPAIGMMYRRDGEVYRKISN